VTAAHFLLGVGMNLFSRSRPERITMIPVAALLWGLSALWRWADELNDGCFILTYR
jgi:hypothetical protein